MTSYSLIFLQALPSNGYTAMFEKMLLNNKDITVRLGVDYFQVKSQLPKHKLLVFTGPIDAYFASQGLAKLEYRSIYFQTEYLEPPTGFFQPAWVVNHPASEFGKVFFYQFLVLKNVFRIHQNI